MSGIVLKGRILFKGKAAGKALVSKDPVYFSGVGLDRQTGTIHWSGHALDGISIKDKVLVMPRALGSAGGDWALYQLRAVSNSAPAAILCSEVDSFTAAGSLLGNIPLVDKLESHVFKAIKDNDFVQIDSERGTLEVIDRNDREQERAEGSEGGREQTEPRMSDGLSLTEEEKAILAGDKGEGAKRCLEFLITYGRVFGAERLVRLGQVHAAACSYRLGGEGALQYLRSMSRTGAKVSVPSTLNPVSLDLERWQSVMRLPTEIHQQTLLMNRAYQDLGFVPLFSCAPYWTLSPPRYGEHIVWGEHNAVCYANSVYGAMTNFEAHLTAIPAAITGRFPEYGLHLKANRRAQAIIKVETPLENSLDWKFLGFFAGKQLVDKIPLFTGLPNHISNRSLRDLTSSMGPPFGRLPMCHILGVTPEAQDMEAAFQGSVPSSVEVLKVGRNELNQVRDSLKGPAGDLDLVTLGCPFYGIEDLKAVARLLRGKRVNPNVQLWIWTDAATRSVASRMDLVQQIEKAGGSVLTDTCAVTCPMDQCDHSFRNVMTDSIKEMAFYRQSGKYNVSLGTTEACIEAAVKGKVEP